MNVCWAVPRNQRPNPARLRSVQIIVTAGLALVGATTRSALTASAGSLGIDLGRVGVGLLTLASVLINAGVFLLVFRISPAHRHTWRHAVPGAIAAALVWQALQTFGTAYVSHVVRDPSDTYGVFALVLGLQAWIFLGALGLVISVEINVVRAKRLYPRALLTPFTDDVDLTRADQTAYTGMVAAQQTKGFQSVDVSFDRDDEVEDGTDGTDGTDGRGARETPDPRGPEEDGG